MSVNSHPGGHAAARKRPVQGRSRRTVDAILDAAARIFEARGYVGATTNHVAEAAGVSIGSLYQYFPNKDALLVALEERHLADARVQIDQTIARWQDAQPTTTTWADDFVATLVEANDSDLHRLVYDTAPPNPHLRRQTDSIAEDLARALTPLLRRWGHHEDHAAGRARVMVVAALRLVHDLVIRAPPGARRAAAQGEVARLLRSYAELADA